MNQYANHRLVTAIGLVIVAAFVLPILNLAWVRDAMYSSEAFTFLIGLGGFVLFITGIFLTFAMGFKRGLAIFFGSAAAIAVLYASQYGTAQIKLHPELVWSLSVMAFGVGGGVSLVIIGLREESVV